MHRAETPIGSGRDTAIVMIARTVVTFVCVVASGFSGYLRFGSMAVTAPFWLDIIFLVSSAIALALCVLFLVAKLHHAHETAATARQADAAVPRDDAAKRQDDDDMPRDGPATHSHRS